MGLLLALLVIVSAQALSRPGVRRPVLTFIDFYRTTQCDTQMSFWQRFVYAVAQANQPTTQVCDAR